MAGGLNLSASLFFFVYFHLQKVEMAILHLPGSVPGVGDAMHVVSALISTLVLSGTQQAARLQTTGSAWYSRVALNRGLRGVKMTVAFSSFAGALRDESSEVADTYWPLTTCPAPFISKDLLCKRPSPVHPPKWALYIASCHRRGN